MPEQDDLTGRILIAMPEMGDPRFRRSVVLICAFSDEGAMGLVLNHGAADLSFRGLMKQIGIEDWEAAPELPVRFGGPVETGRGFVLHRTRGGETADGEGGAMALPGGLAISTTRDILEDITAGRGPEQAIMALGYAGWGPGQLEAEILANGWLVGAMRDEYAFGPPGQVWQDALRDLGVDAITLSSTAGRA